MHLFTLHMFILIKRVWRLRNIQMYKHCTRKQIDISNLLVSDNPQHTITTALVLSLLESKYPCYPDQRILTNQVIPYVCYPIDQKLSSWEFFVWNIRSCVCCLIYFFQIPLPSPSASIVVTWLWHSLVHFKSTVNVWLVIIILW